jgi:hypothetical protein
MTGIWVCSPLTALAAAAIATVDLLSALTPNVRWRGHLLLHVEGVQELRVFHALAIPVGVVLLIPLSTAPYEAEAGLAKPPANILPLRAAVRKEPRQLSLRFELGLAYLRAGQKAAAVRELEAALRLDPRSDDVVRALRSARGR